MLNVILIEDNTFQRNMLLDSITRYLIFETLDAKVVLTTSSGTKVLEYIKSAPKDSYFFIIDIKLNDENYSGIKLAKKIRQLLPYENIVFLASNAEFGLAVLENRIKPLDYIIKSSDLETTLHSVRQDILLTLKQNEHQKPNLQEIFNYKLGRRYYSLPVVDILFFESVPDRPNIVVLHAKDQVIEFNDSLKNLENKLPQSFFRCHKSYLINLDNIHTFDRKRALVYFDAKETVECKVSFRKARELVKILKK